MPPILRTTAVAIVAVLVGLGFVAPAAGTTHTHDAQATAGPAQQASPNGCDYASLYDQTNESVVSVESDRGFGSGFVYRTGAGDAAATGGNETAGNATDDLGENESLVVTNAHVVGDADTVRVQFSRDEIREGSVIGQDDLTDLAIVRVNDTPMYVDPLETDASQPRHGEPVAALGSPFGFDETITHGIVSGVNRSLPTTLGFAIPNTVQTDTPISPGSSGGPLVDCDGTVIGVTTAGIAAPGAENLGFAISSQVVERVAPRLVEEGEFAHPFIGIAGADVTPAIAEANGLDEPTGVAVLEVRGDTPAADVLRGSTDVERRDGELVPVGGDVIVAVNGTPVDNAEELSSVLLFTTSPGDRVELTVVRDGERTNVTTTLVERPDPVIG